MREQTPGKFGEISGRISAQWQHIPAKPIDYSFKEINEISDLETEEPQSGSKTVQNGQVNTSIKLSNNFLARVTELPRVMESMMAKLHDIAWIDISFNKLTTIDPVLLQFPNLGSLYMHANQIHNINEVEKLGKLSQLRNLTLHGNPVENTKGYRSLVLRHVPQLRHLDFCAITKQDRTVAKTTISKRANRRQKEE